MNTNTLQNDIERIVLNTPVYDIHTHLYAPAFGDLLLFGIDDLLVYHYLVAEAFRFLDVPYEKFWAMSKSEQADLVWRHLFIEQSPLSESCRGVITTLNKLGLDVRSRDLLTLRQWFASQNADDFTTRCMEIAKVRRICMTNSPFDDSERAVWERGYTHDERFSSALRIDPLLMEWPNVTTQLRDLGYDVSAELNDKTVSEVRRFLGDWTTKIDALYVMVSLPPTFACPSNDVTSQLIEKCVVPFCRERNLPFALMIGVKRAVNPQLQLAGDGLGRADLISLENLCAANPDVKFLTTVLARENQHELNVLARKFRNLHPFGCWWFTNIPVVIEDMTRMRLELLGTSVTLQHSDARVLDQIIYKWDHSRQITARVLTEKYLDLAASGWNVSIEEIERDVHNLLGGSFEKFLAL